VHPLMGFALAHAEQASLDDWQRVDFPISAQKAETVLGCRQRAVFVDGQLARRPRLPIAAPRRPRGWKRGRAGWHQRRKLLECHAGHIPECRGAILDVGRL
jgi:hypothetical protein